VAGGGLVGAQVSWGGGRWGRGVWGGRKGGGEGEG